MHFPKPNQPDLGVAFASLAPAAQLTAQICGVVSPLAYTAPELARMLRFANLQVGGVTTTQVQQAAEELVRRGVAYRPGRDSRLTGAPQWAPWLTMEAWRNGLLERIREGHNQESPFWRYESERSWMELRCNTVAGRFDLISPQTRAERWGFLAQPGAGALLATLPEQHRERALRGCLSEVIYHAAPPEQTIAACSELASDLVLLAVDMAFIRVLQGRLDEAQAIFAELPARRRDSKPAHVGRASVDALIATLRGDDQAALRGIEAAVAAHKAGTRKRTAFPESAAFALSLLALVRSDSSANRARLVGLLRTGRRLKVSPLIVEVIEHAAQIRSGLQAVDLTDLSPGLPALLQGLIYCWAGDRKPYLHSGVRRAFAGYLERAAARGFAWALAECLAVIGHAGADLDPGRGQAPAAAAKQAAAMHRRLGTRTLTDLMPPVADWEFPLKALEQFAFETRGTAAASGAGPASAGPRRLVWDLVCDGDRISVTPREQRAQQNGAWSRGRSRSLQWLATAAASADVLQERDRAAAALIKRDRLGRGGALPHHLDAALLFELAGHPHVYNAAGASVDIVRSGPELVIDQHAGGVRASLIPDDWDAEPYHARMVGDRRCEVMQFTRSHQRLRMIIPPGGLELPADARTRLLEAASALVSVVRIHGGIEGGARSARAIEADAQPRVRLEPSGGGLGVQLVVEPVAGSGTYFTPGAGGTLVFAHHDGQTVQARRDLPAERAAADRLASACPQLLDLDPTHWSAEVPEPTGALELLEQLEAAGARCLWPHGEPFKIVARAETAQLRLSIRSAADWLRASGELPIDERRVLDLKQLFALLDASPGSRFLELSAGEFVSLTGSFRRQLDDLRSLASPAAQGELRLHPLAALALDEFVEQTRLDADEGWRALQQRLRRAQAFDPQVPSTLQAELRPYQREGFRWLARVSRWGAGACLADDMGLGKTVQVLALLLERAPAGPALVVVPTSVVANWLDEARRFAPTLNPLAYTGPEGARAPVLAELGPFDVVITTYALLHIDAEQLGAIAWHSAVLDEAQAIKNPATKRARAARALQAGFRLVTTGTPIQNNLTDLHSLFSFLNPGMLGSLEQFRRTFALPIERDGDAEARGRLRRLVAPFLLRRLKTEVLDDLPPRTEIVLQVEMSPPEAAFYEALRRRAVEDLESLPGAGPGAGRLQILAHLMRLRRACCNPALVQEEEAPPSSKLAMFAETLAELLENRHKVLVFSQFVGHLRLIEAYLKDAGVAYQYLDGSTPARARRERIAAFQAGQGDVFLISLGAGGVGLNLTAADYVMHMDPWWNPAVEDQASDRAHRIGQTRPVTIYRLVTKGTIEEQIVDLHHRKRDLAERLLVASDAPARLDAAELLALLRQPLV